MSWREKQSERISSSQSMTQRSPKQSRTPRPSTNDSDLNLTLYGSKPPLRMARSSAVAATVVKRVNSPRKLSSRSSTLGSSYRQNSIPSGTKLFIDDTTLDLGFSHKSDDDNALLNSDAGDTSCASSSRRSSSMYCRNRRRKTSESSMFDSEMSDDNYTSKQDYTATSDDELSPEYMPMRNAFHKGYSSLRNRKPKRETNTVSETKGEWNNFWKNYNNPAGFTFFPTNDASKFSRETSKESDTTAPSTGRLDSEEVAVQQHAASPQIQKVIMSTADAIEAARCARRLSEILSSAIRRSSLPCTNKNVTKQELKKLKKIKSKNCPESNTASPVMLSDAENNISRSRSEPELPLKLNALDLQNQKMLLKPIFDMDYIEIEIQPSDQSDIAQILKNALIKRRNVIEPQEDVSACVTSRSEWSVVEHKK